MSLNVEQVSHFYGTDQALDEVDIEIGQGEIVSLVGPSGCDKTTLLRLIAGFDALSSGEITLNEKVLANGEGALAPEERAIGFVFQDFALFPHMTVEKNVAFGLSGLKGKERKQRVNEELAAVSLTEFAGKFPHELSGGQQQRVALARAFVRRPALMLLDEPFSSLDSAMRHQLRSSMRLALKARNATALIVTHDPEEALALGDRIALLNEGRLVEVASPSELYHTPKTLDGALMIDGAQKIDGVLSDAIFMTDLGEIKLGQSIDPDGPAAIVVHGDDLSVAVDPDGQAKVVDCNFVGPGWTISIMPVNNTASSNSLYVNSDIHLEPDQRVTLHVASVAGVFTSKSR